MYSTTTQKQIESHVLMNHTIKCGLCKNRFSSQQELNTHVVRNHTFKCGICDIRFGTQHELNVHEKNAHPIEENRPMERQSDVIDPPQPIENDDSNIKHQLQLKCNFLEEELGKERLCNQKNVKLVETSAKTIAELKKGIESANARTISKNEELVDKEGKVKEFKKKVDDEILKN